MTLELIVNKKGSFDPESFSREVMKLEAISENKIISIVKVKGGFYINDNQGTREIKDLKEVDFG